MAISSISAQPTMGSSTLQGRCSTNDAPKAIKMRHLCLLIACIVVLDTSPCVEAAPFGHRRGAFRKSLTASKGDPPLQLEADTVGKRRHPLLLQKILGQIRGGSDDETPVVSADETTGGHHGDSKRRRRRRRKKARSSQADGMPDVGVEEPEDTPPAAAAGGDDGGDEASKEGEDSANKSWLESYLSGAGGVDNEADIGATQGEPGDDDARTTNDHDSEACSTVKVKQAQDDNVEGGSEIVPDPEGADGEDSQQTGQRRRRRRRRRNTAATTIPLEEEGADQTDIVEEDDDQTIAPTDEEEEGTVIEMNVPAEVSNEASEGEVNDPAATCSGGGGRVKIRRRRRRKSRANAAIEEPDIIVEEEESTPIVNEDDQGDSVVAGVGETQTKMDTVSSPGDDHEESADVPSNVDAPSDPAENVTTQAESAPEAEESSTPDDTTEEESGGDSEEIGDEEVEQKEDSANSDREGGNDDEKGSESNNNDSEGEESEQEAEGADSSDNISDQSENNFVQDEAKTNDSEIETSSDSVEEAGAETIDTSTGEGEDVDSENAASEDTSDDSSTTESSDEESDGEESEDSEENDSGASNEDSPSENIAESDEEEAGDDEVNPTSEADSSPAEESSDDDEEAPSANDEEAPTVVEALVNADTPETTEVGEEEDSTLVTGDADHESVEVVEPTEITEESSEEVKIGTCAELSADDGDDEDDSTKITVSVVTWNLAEASPSEDEAKFIRRFRKAHPALSSRDGRKGSDIVLIGGQETEDIKPRRAEGNRSRELRRLVIQMLGKDYVPIAIHSLGGVQFCLCVRREILNEIELCSVADVTCGIGNVFHNKGAICAYVQMKARTKQGDNNGIDEESSTTKRQKSVKMLFVAAHMAAHVKNVDARNEDFWRIASELEAQAPPRFLRPKSPREQALVDAENGGGSYLMDSMDHVFFCGDLNYRIDLPREITEYTVMQIKECLQQGNEREADKLRLSLLRHDQLSRVMSEGAAFPGFAEGKITFPPTFKFDKGTKSYDTSHKQRVPAFTDRILFKPFGVRVLEYRSEVDATHSDHRPVTGTFLVDIEGKKVPEQSRKHKPKRRSRRKTSRPATNQY